MFSYFKKPKLASTALVMAGLLSLLVFGIITFLLSANFNYQNAPKNYTGEKFLMKNTATVLDPMITKNPGLKEILAGPIISDRDPSLGSAASPITIVLFSDFTCNYCQKQEAELKKLLATYQDKIQMIWKDYPENKYESTSYQAALAARCAFEQNKFWSFHDLLFQAGSKMDSKTYYSIAKTVALDMPKFEKCFAGGQTKKYIEDNITEANALEINGVPFIYVNDQEIMGTASLTELESIIKLELSKQSRK